jgi:hypothetical protein
MQLSFSFGISEESRACRLEKVLAAARRTAYYSAYLPGPPGDGSAERAISNLPPVDIGAYLAHREQFRNPGARMTDSGADRLRAAPSGWRQKLGFRAETIAGPLQALLRLVGSGEKLPASVRRVVVHTGLGELLLSERTRETLWRAFELPVFEELRGSGGEVLAFECDAHAGLHLKKDSAIFEILDGELVVTSLAAMAYPVVRLRTGLKGTIERGPCPCGETVARFIPAAASGAGRKAPAGAQTMRTSLDLGLTRTLAR